MTISSRYLLAYFLFLFSPNIFSLCTSSDSLLHLSLILGPSHIQVILHKTFLDNYLTGIFMKYKIQLMFTLVVGKKLQLRIVHDS